MSGAKRRARPLGALIALLACAAVCCAAEAPGTPAAPRKVVQVSLKATWDSTPLLLEASEAVSGIGGADLFWSFAAAVAAGPGEGATERDAYESAALPAAAPLLSAEELRLLKLALAIREKSPAVQAQFELAADVCQRLYYRAAVAAEAKGAKAEGRVPPRPYGEAWATVGGAEAVVTSPAALAKALKGLADDSGAGPRLYEHDHVLRAPGAESAPVVVLYGRLGSPALAPLYAAAAQLAADGKAALVLRHFRDCAQGEAARQPMPLQGYGVEMAIKNMEYIALDDTNVTGKAVDEEGGEGPAGEGDAAAAVEEGVETHLFDSLIKRKPSRRAALATLREQVSSGAMAARRLTERQLKELGVQAAQSIGAADDPLRLLRDVAWNAPLLAPVLSRLAVDHNVRQEAAVTQRHFRPGEARLFVNGRELDADGLDPFRLVDAVREELALVRRLRPLRLAPRSLQRVVAAGVSGRESGGGAQGAIRVDFRDPSVLYVNDVETDKQYARWPRSLLELLTPTWPGQFRQLRRNIYTAVFAVDLGTVEGAAQIDRLSRYINNNAPVRFGLITVPATRALSPGAAAEGAAGPSPREAGRRRLRSLLGGESAASDVLTPPAAAAGTLNAAHPSGHAEGELCTAPEPMGTKPPCAEGEEAAAEDGSEAAGERDATKYEATASLAAARAFHYFWASGRPWALSFAKQLASARGAGDDMEAPVSSTFDGPLTMEEVAGAFERTLAAPPTTRAGKRVPLKTRATFEEATAEGGGHDELAVGGLAVLKRAGLEGAALPAMFVNGRVFSGREVEGRLFEALQEELTMLQSLVHTGAIPDKTEDILDALLSGAGGRLAPALKRYRASLFPEEPSAKQIMEPPPGEEAAATGPQLKFVPLARFVRPAAAVADAEGDLGLDLGVEEPSGGDAAARPAEEGTVATRLLYLRSPGMEDGLAGVTHWLAADLARAEDRADLAAALEHLASSAQGQSRLALLQLCAEAPAPVAASAAARVTARAALLATSALGGPGRPSWSPAKIGPFVRALLALHDASDVDGEIERAAAVVRLAKKMRVPSDLIGLLLSHLTGAAAADADAALRNQSAFATKSLGLPAGAPGLLTNGRVVSIAGGAMEAADFAALEAFEAQRAARVRALLDTLEFEGVAADELNSEWLGDVAMGAVSVLGAELAAGRTAARTHLPDLPHKLTMYSSESSGGVRLYAVVDPISPAAQRLAPLLMAARDALGTGVTLVLNPMPQLTSMPINNFFRFVLAPELAFDASGSPAAPAAQFSQLPAEAILTIGLHTPESWLTQSTYALYDADNVRLSEVPATERLLNFEYELENIVVTGHCYDARLRQPPRGLKLVLGTRLHPHATDTLVMSNLGYFQLKANPGSFRLALAPGRPSRLYRIASVDSTFALADGSGRYRQVVVSDFKGVVVPLWVQKQPGMEAEQLLDEKAIAEVDAEVRPAVCPHLEDCGAEELAALAREEGEEKGKGKPAGLWSRLSSMLSRPAAAGAGSEDEPVNIFSVASGHLYERFLRIMTVAVMRRTRRPVKFWFIKNYLSPKFKAFMPTLAARYNYTYDFVTYKWPSWLHKQTEKQRIIWAYKILFLDVLFPISTRKVIFIDADQISRADMRELHDMDLQGAPVAMTPFCETNRETDGYRFWTSGFWKEHLRGKPYHISALFVVDLVRLRQMAAGDQYRVTYDQLSRDPNSLSNLDQDLPNYAQHSIPIFSLPVPWLWCESWCGDGDKPAAKTIDLCNNPMTKEPKLQQAKRIIPEWEGYDNEVREILTEWEAKQGQAPPPEGPSQ